MSIEGWGWGGGWRGDIRDSSALKRIFILKPNPITVSSGSFLTTPELHVFKVVGEFPSRDGRKGRGVLARPASHPASPACLRSRVLSSYTLQAQYFIHLGVLLGSCFFFFSDYLELTTSLLRHIPNISNVNVKQWYLIMLRGEYLGR